MYADPLIYAALAMLFNAMLKHDKVLICFGSSILRFKVKYKGLSGITNYRPISIMPVATKIFESYVEKFLDKYLVSHLNQFDFVHDDGCSKAISVFSSK